MYALSDLIAAWHPGVFLIWMFACSGEPAQGTTPTRKPTLDTAWPLSPDLGEAFDPRVAGCTTTSTSLTTPDIITSTYDDAGHLVHQTIRGETYGAPFVTEEEIEWDEDCIILDTKSMDWADAINLEVYENTCDEHGNVTSTTYTDDDGAVTELTWTNEYDGSFLVARESASEVDGATSSNSSGYMWSGLFVTEVAEVWVNEIGTAQFSLTYTVDEIGQILEFDSSFCDITGTQGCSPPTNGNYEYDTEHRAIAGTGSVDDDTFTTVFVPGDAHVPASSTITWASGNDEAFEFASDCG